MKTAGFFFFFGNGTIQSNRMLIQAGTGSITQLIFLLAHLVLEYEAFICKPH